MLDTEMRARPSQDGPSLGEVVPAPLHRLQEAEYEAVAGPFKVRGSLRLTPAGILAVGVMVSGILLATSCLVWSGASVARRRSRSG